MDDTSSGSGGGFLSGFTLKDMYGDAVDILKAKAASRTIGSNAGPSPASVGTAPNAPQAGITQVRSTGSDFSLPDWAWVLLGTAGIALVIAVAVKAMK